MYKELATALRILSADVVEKANSGHPGMPLGIADVVTVLFTKFLKFSPSNPRFGNRDRFVLSAGHASALLYSLFYLYGSDEITLDDLKNFRNLGYKTAGHPELHEIKSVEVTTGPLGQGIANGVGIAISERLASARFGNIISHKTYVLCGDGCMMEGVALEALQLAGHLSLKNFVLIYDKNDITIDGKLSVSSSVDYPILMKSYGFDVYEIDGHNYEDIESELQSVQSATRPSIIIANTTIAKYSGTKEGSEKSHGSPLGASGIAELRTNLEWNHAPFDIPERILSQWRKIKDDGKKIEDEWLKNAKSDAHYSEYCDFINGTGENNVLHVIANFAKKIQEIKPKMATRELSGKIIEEMIQKSNFLIGGSADLSVSNNTKSSTSQVISRDSFSGNYIHYGIREHGMAGIMNGIASYGGFIPFGGTFLVFSDYMRPSIRIAALSNQRVIYIFTHDSIGLGEDGPTHQPVEHIASLRMIPNIQVFRPCDGVEVAQSWKQAITYKGPSALILSRQALQFMGDFRTNISKGAYLINNNQHDITLIASGSEVSLAHEISQNTGYRVVSMMCMEIFQSQNDTYKQSVLGRGIRVFIETATSHSFIDLYRPGIDIMVSMTTFGASGKASDLFTHFGFTAESITKKIQEYTRT